MLEQKWNKNWKFWEDKDSFALVWNIPEIARDITLPHDAMIEKPANPDSLNGGNTGFRDGDVYTYVKMLHAPDEYREKTVMLKFEGVKKHYEDFELNLTLEVPEGYVTGLIGANGAGKSTAFKAALGLIRPDAGVVKMLGKNVKDFTVQDKERIGVVLADSGFSGYLRVKDILPMLESMYHKFQKEDFLEMCKKYQLPLDKKIKEFSTGMKRKLQIAAAVSHGADVLFMDESTAGLDVMARDEMLDILREYMETPGRFILISSHISTDLEGICDDIYMIDEGKILLHEETDKLLDQYGLLKVKADQYEALDKAYILAHKKEEYGYSCLTNERQYYQENYPDITIEKGKIDDVIIMMKRGQQE